MKEALPRLDSNLNVYKSLLSFCRLKRGEIWEDPLRGHRVGVLDACSEQEIALLMKDRRAVLAIQDPPYNIKVGNKNTEHLFRLDMKSYLEFSQKWVANTIAFLEKNSHLYIWLGADQNRGFQPLPDFMLMMRNFATLTSRSFITMRNQRGYGTQKNWMCARQELLYYVKGSPDFNVCYTDIPKVLKGYYKVVNGRVTENLERSKSDRIRPGNVWLDIQQVFYKMEENVPGAYAQKPLKAILRIIETSSKRGELICDFFAHSGTTLIGAELSERMAFVSDIDPVFAEITIRRLENFRQNGKTGWQYENPFPELG